MHCESLFLRSVPNKTHDLVMSLDDQRLCHETLLCDICGCLPVTRRATTVPAQQLIPVLWSSALPLLTACLDDSEPHLQAGDVIPTTHATSAAQPGVYQRPLFK
ncbi:hypothetical protein T06_13445 [Trichinella sp. T6]|nr:hypothetical protein T06_15330 [Trichinella sp. T6]KRX73786.1 hypothetical protein T06_13445 [Trichinella sp. T6]